MSSWGGVRRQAGVQLLNLVEEVSGQTLGLLHPIVMVLIDHPHLKVQAEYKAKWRHLLMACFKTSNPRGAWYMHEPPVALALLLVQPAPGARRVCGAATSDR